MFAFLALLLRLLAPNFFWHVITPVFRVSEAISTESGALLMSFSNATQLAARNEELVNENAALANENMMLMKNSAEVSALLGGGNASGIVAGVVARPPESPYDTLVLATGSNGGVTLGMEAFGSSGVPIGVVSSVLDDFSRVTLFSAPGVSTSVWVGQASTPLIIRGSGAGAMNASAARAAGIAVGDIVFAPGPGQLPIGSVVRVDSDPLSPSVTLRIMPAENPFKIAWVLLRATGVVPMEFATTAP
jgi:cell shape-determining protein MreC